MAGLSAGAMMMPFSAFGKEVSIEELLEPSMDVKIKKRLAEAALNTATKYGASYADVRIARSLNQFIRTREKAVRNIVNTDSFGVGIRVIVNGTWGFASTNEVTDDGIRKATMQAVAIAKANSKFQTEPVKLVPAGSHGDVTWKTPIEKNAFEVPISDKTDMLLTANSEALKNGANYVNTSLFLVNEQKYFASTDGSFIDQDIHRIWPTFQVTSIDKSSGKFKTRAAMSAPMGMGYEYLNADPKEKLEGPSGIILYRNSYDLIEDAREAAKQTKDKLKAESVKPGKYDLVLEPNHLGLTIHESIGHATELDRVLGYEANYAGTSFATLDKWESKNFKYGSEIVNVFADKTQENSLGNVGYDDEGVKTKQWDIIKNGVLVNYQAIRDQAHIINEKESHGCCYASGWNHVQFQRMPNISLAPNKEKYSLKDMISDVENGIYIAGRGSFSIDQQRYNFQFGGQLFFEIKNGKITQMLEDVTYQSNTQEFWNSCTKICDKGDYRLFGSFFDGKGQPPQISSVSHGSSTTRFNNVNVINSSRKI